MNLGGPWVIWGVAILAILFFVATAVGIWRGSLRAFGFWEAVKTSFGRDASTRLTSLGIAALLLPSVVNSVATALVRFALGVVVYAPLALIGALQHGTAPCANASDPACGAAQVASVAQAVTGALQAAFGQLDPKSVSSIAGVLVFLGVWTVAAQLFDHTVGGTGVGGEATGKGPIHRLWSAIVGAKPHARTNVLFAVVLAVGTYLSIAAIASVPDLSETPLSADDVRQLSARFDEGAQSKEFDERYPAELPETYPFNTLQEKLTTLIAHGEGVAAPGAHPVITAAASARPVVVAPTAASDATNTPGTAAQAAPSVGFSVANQIEDEVHAQIEERKRVRDGWAALRTKVKQKLGDANATAKRVFEVTNLGRGGQREEAEHFLQIDEWYRQQTSELYRTLDRCENEIEELDNGWASWSSEVSKVIDAPNESRSFPPLLQFNPFNNLCTVSIELDPVPKREPLGDRLGPFGLIARWLLQTESLPLTLITGMLGFGLVGSAISSSIRGPADGNEKETPIVADLPLMCLRGVSAAFVIFLAVEGGIAIFAPGITHPNPYVVLLTCFVAAVFSEDVWKKARAWFLSGGGGGTGAAGGAGSGAGGNGGGAPIPVAGAAGTDASADEEVRALAKAAAERLVSGADGVKRWVLEDAVKRADGDPCVRVHLFGSAEALAKAGDSVEITTAAGTKVAVPVRKTLE